VAHSNWLRVFAAPLGLAAASSLGFIAAFPWGDIGRYVCWLGIGLPLVVIAWVAPSRLFSAQPVRVGDFSRTGCAARSRFCLIPFAA